jgi:hypothetical protein
MSAEITAEWERAVGLRATGKLHEAALCFGKIIRLLNSAGGAAARDVSNTPQGVVRKLAGKAEQELQSTLKSLSETSPYFVLGLNGADTEAKVKKAYRKMALQYHPDRNKDSNGLFVVIHGAYERLDDPSEKRRVDQQVRVSHAFATHTNGDTAARGPAGGAEGAAGAAAEGG